MAEVNLKIDGMSCGHCVMAVKKALDNLNGVTSSEVAIGSAKVTYDAAKTGKENIEDAVKKAGYKIV
ncbi:MAG: cation transporter [Thermodesulfovibrionia bacterium]|nr:cation transporter [Thermodesulfovibrionia bacterium]